jgi:hypothetical protein
VRYYPPTPAALYRLKRDTARAKDRQMRRHCARFWAIAPRRYPRGVFKFRTIEDAQAARERLDR